MQTLLDGGGCAGDSDGSSCESEGSAGADPLELELAPENHRLMDALLTNDYKQHVTQTLPLAVIIAVCTKLINV